MTDAALSAPWRLGIHVAQWMILPNVEDLETNARQDVEMEPSLHLKNVMMATQPEVMDVAAHVWSNVGGYAVQTWGALLELAGTVKLQEPKSVTTATLKTATGVATCASKRTLWPPFSKANAWICPARPCAAKGIHSAAVNRPVYETLGA